MKNVLAKVPISKIVNLDTLLVPIKNNEDDLKIIVTNYKKKIYAYLNSCPHDTRPLCKDPEYLWTKKKQLQCMHHQALFNPQDGRCIKGPCEGDYLLKISTIQKNGELIFYKEGF